MSRLTRTALLSAVSCIVLAWGAGSTSLAEPETVLTSSVGNERPDMFPPASKVRTIRIAQASTPAASQPASNPASRTPPPPTDLFSGDEQADPATPAQTPASGAASTAAGQPPAVDETALRYFAQQGDTRRLEAEIARLKALYPNWTPPANPLEAPAVGDPQLDRMWQLYSQEKYAEVREAIAARQQAEPGWQPPSDLLDRLSVAEARVRLVNASNLQQYETVIRVAAANPSLLTCSEVDVLWRVARAFAETGRDDRSGDAYGYILKNCDNPGERLATIQMAAQYLPRAGLDPLLSLERKTTDGVGEFQSVRADIARQSVSNAGNDAEIVVPPADLDLLRQLADSEKKASDFETLGWYELRRKNNQAAADWFGKARDAGDSVTISQGDALALIGLGRFAEAEEVMANWRTASDGAKAVYLAAAANLLASQAGSSVDTPTLGRIVSAVSEARDPAVAQQLGWYAFGLNQFATAGQWFSTALAWKSDDEVSAYGLALVRRNLGDAAGLAQLKAQWQAKSPRIVAIGTSDEARVAAAATAGVPPSAANAVASLAGAVQPTTPSSATAYAPVTQGAAIITAPATIAPVQAPVQPVVEPQPRTERNAPSPRRQSAARASSGGSARSGSCPSQIDPGTLSPDAALNRGWCLLNLNRATEAASAFESAATRGSGKTRQDASYGESLAYLRLGISDRAALAAGRSPQPANRRAELDTAILSARAVAAFEAKRPVEALQALDERARISPERLDLMVMRGYAYLDLRRYGDAERVFSAVARSGNPEGARGLSAIKEAIGMFRSGG